MPPPPEAGSSSEPSAEPGIAELFQAIRKQAWLVGTVTLIFVVGAAAYGFSRPKIYRASTVVQIDPRPPQPLGRGVESVVEIGAASYWASKEYYQTQHQLIASRPVALAVVRELGLHLDRGFVANLPSAPEVDSESKPITEEVAAAALSRRLEVNPVKESRLVEVTFDDASKSRATRVLDAVLRAYVAHNMNTAMESTSSAVEWLSEQLGNLRGDLSESEDALHQYKLEKQIASIGIDGQTSLLKREMEQLSEARTKVETQIQQASARLAQLRKIDPERPESVPQMDLLQTTDLQKLRGDYLHDMGIRDALLQSGKGEMHPEVQAASSRVKSGLRALSTEIRNVQSGAERELAALQQQLGGLSQLLGTAEKEALKLNLMEIEYSRLQRTKDNNEKMYSLVLERSKEAGLTQVLKVNNIQTVSPAATSDSPVAPRLTLILGAGSLFGFALGAVIAFGRETMDRSIRSAEELEQRLGLASLGSMPRISQASGNPRLRGRRARRNDPTGERSGNLDLLVHEKPTHAFSEAVRAVRTNLLFMSPDKPFRRLLVTSPNPGEGKTTIACNLAIAMAQTGKRVLFVDCDLRRPRLEKIFPRASSEPRASLSQSLFDPSRAVGMDLTTNIPNLSVLGAGPIPPNPTELLHSEAFRNLLEELSAGYDLVVIDSPPLMVTDAAILSNLVDGVVLVARAFQTHRSAAVSALRSLRDVGGNVIGSVLNGVGAQGGYGYRYGYKYGYGYGYGHEQSQGESKEDAKGSGSRGGQTS